MDVNYKITVSPEAIQADTDKLVKFLSMYCAANHKDMANNKTEPL